MYTRKYNFTAEEMSCRNCTEYLPGGICKKRKCPYMEQRIEANTVTYGDVLTAICFPNRKVRKRLLFLIAEYPDSFWLDEHHKARMKQLHDRLGFTKKRNTPIYYAAMYLLTASDTLLSRTIKCFTDTDIDFSFATMSGISLDDYILYKAAVCYYTKEGGVTLGELADKELISDQMFRLVINGLLIAKYGLVAMILKKHKEGANKQ